MLQRWGKSKSELQPHAFLLIAGHPSFLSWLWIPLAIVEPAEQYGTTKIDKRRRGDWARRSNKNPSPPRAAMGARLVIVNVTSTLICRSVSSGVRAKLGE